MNPSFIIGFVNCDLKVDLRNYTYSRTFDFSGGKEVTKYKELQIQRHLAYPCKTERLMTPLGQGHSLHFFKRNTKFIKKSAFSSFSVRVVLKSTCRVNQKVCMWPYPGLNMPGLLWIPILKQSPMVGQIMD